MSRIRVDPDHLRELSVRVNRVREDLLHTAEDVRRAGEGLPSYNGQFGPRVAGIAARDSAASREQGHRAEEHATRLEERSVAFADADLAGERGLAALGRKFMALVGDLPLLNLLGRLRVHPSASIESHRRLVVLSTDTDSTHVTTLGIPDHDVGHLSQLVDTYPTPVTMLVTGLFPPLGLLWTGAVFYHAIQVKKERQKEEEERRRQEEQQRGEEQAAEEWNELIESFGVEGNQSYIASEGKTHCNGFVADVINRRAGYYDPTYGRPSAKKYADDVPLPTLLSNGWHLNVNRMVPWLRGDELDEFDNSGPSAEGRGWIKVDDASTAINYANKGVPVVVGWENKSGDHGHIALLRAGNDVNTPVSKLKIAQAGLTNFSEGRLEDGFGEALQRKQRLEFFVYDPPK